MEKVKLSYAKGIYGEEEKQAVLRSLDSGWLSGGKETDGFEKEVAAWWGVKYALATNSGSNANFVALQSLGLEKGDEVITPAGGAFPTTISPMYYLGLVPVYIDIKDYVIDVDKIEEAITDKTKAIVFAHTIGKMPNMDKLMAIAKRYNLKVMEDCCFPAKTKIKVKNGDKNIEDVKVGDFVLTRDGYKKVLKSWKTGTKNIINNFGITATPDHPIITKNGVKRLDKLIASDIIYIWNEKQSSIKETVITDTQSQNLDKDGFISIDIQKKHHFLYIGKYGLIILEKLKKVMSYTIKMIILLIMKLKILSVFLKRNIVKNTLLQKEKSSQEKISKLHKKKHLNGTGLKKELNFTKELQNFLIKTEKEHKKDVQSAINCIVHTFQKNQYIAQDYVKAGGIIKKGKVDVYNLTIDGSHEFFANNVLVHNCDAVGSRQNEKMAGTFGDIATVSLYPAHHMTTGEGGIILTNNPKLYREALSIRDWGRDCTCHYGGDNPICRNRYAIPGFDHRYYYTRLGLNCKMTEMQAAFGREQLKRLSGFVEVRRINYNILANALEEPECGELSPFCYPVVSGNKKRDCDLLNSAGIETRFLFSGNILKHPAYKNLEYRVSGSLVNSDKIFDEVYFVGVAPHLTEENMLYIADNILQCRNLP